MKAAFDIGIESLARAGETVASSPFVSDTHEAVTSEATAAGAGKSFYIETFGCQMNVHDSEKVAGFLLERGYRAARDAADADLMLYNTCSIREKAAQ